VPGDGLPALGQRQARDADVGLGRDAGQLGRGRGGVQQAIVVGPIQLEQRQQQLPREPADAGALVEAGAEIDADADGGYFRWETK
jgi:hypothetical protein